MTAEVTATKMSPGSPETCDVTSQKKKKVTTVLVDHVYSQSQGISWRSTSSLVHESWISICSLSHWGGTSRVTFLPWCQCSNGWLAVTASILLLHKTPELVSSTTGSCEDHSRTLVHHCTMKGVRQIYWHLDVLHTATGMMQCSVQCCFSLLMQKGFISQFTYC